MIAAGPLLDELYSILNAKNDQEMKRRIDRQLNSEYFELCRECSIAALRAPPVTLDFSEDTDATGLYLPSDLLGIDLVWDDENDQEFVEKDRPAASLDEWGYRYYRYLPTRTSLYEGSDLILATGASSFTSTALTAAGTAVNGYYAQFDDEPGFYKLTSGTTPFTFEPTYHGPAKSQAAFSIRPWQYTQKMCIIDPDEAAIDDRIVYVHYWRAPVPIYRRSDVIMLPHAEVLKLRVLRSIPEAKGRFSVSESMLSNALRKMLSLNPAFSRISSPVDKHHVKFDGATDIFTTR